MNLNDIKDNFIAILGGNGLIGRELALALKEIGAKTILIDLTNDVDLFDEYLELDLFEIDNIDDKLSVLKHKKNIVGFVNCSYPRTKNWGDQINDVKVDDLKKNIEAQLISTIITTRFFAELFKSYNRGSIVNFSSIYGVVGPSFDVYHGTNMTMPVAYSGIKGGIINLTRYFASLYGEFGVRINCISPGGVKDKQNPQFIKNYEKKVPMKRMALPHEIAPTILYLLSENFSSYVTGQNIVIDGGWTSI